MLIASYFFESLAAQGVKIPHVAVLEKKNANSIADGVSSVKNTGLSSVFMRFFDIAPARAKIRRVFLHVAKGFFRNK